MCVRFCKVDEFVQIILRETEPKWNSLHDCTVIEDRIEGSDHNWDKLIHTKKPRNLPLNISTFQKNPGKEESDGLDNDSLPILHIDKSQIQYCLEEWEREKKKRQREGKENRRNRSRNDTVYSAILWKKEKWILALDPFQLPTHRRIWSRIEFYRKQTTW